MSFKKVVGVIVLCLVGSVIISTAGYYLARQLHPGSSSEEPSSEISSIEDPSSDVSSIENPSSEDPSSESSSFEVPSSEVPSSSEETPSSSQVPVETLPAVFPHYQEQYEQEGFTTFSNVVRADFGIAPGTASYASLEKNYLTRVADSDGSNAVYGTNSARVQTINTQVGTSEVNEITTYEYRLGWTSATAAVTTNIPTPFFQGKLRVAYVMSKYSLINYGTIASAMVVTTSATAVVHGTFIRGEDMIWKPIAQANLAVGEHFQFAYVLSGSADSKSVTISQFGITLNPVV